MMTLRWQTNPFDLLNQEVNRLFGDFGRPTWPALATGYPQVNIWEDENHLYAEAELPGMQLDQIEVFVSDNNQVTIQGERKPEEIQGTWHRRERGFGKFSRVVELPYDVDADKVEARFEHGVLRLTLPKAEHVKPRRIRVKGE